MIGVWLDGLDEARHVAVVVVLVQEFAREVIPVDIGVAMSRTYVGNMLPTMLIPNITGFVVGQVDSFVG